MARSFFWRNCLVEIQTRYHGYRVCALVKIDEQEIGCYGHFEEAMAAIRAVVLGNASSLPLTEMFSCECRQLREKYQAM